MFVIREAKVKTRKEEVSHLPRSAELAVPEVDKRNGKRWLSPLQLENVVKILAKAYFSGEPEAEAMLERT